MAGWIEWRLTVSIFSFFVIFLCLCLVKWSCTRMHFHLTRFLTTCLTNSCLSFSVSLCPTPSCPFHYRFLSFSLCGGRCCLSCPAHFCVPAPPSSGGRFSIMCNDSVLCAGFQIDTPDSQGRTCLHAAAAGGWGLCYENVHFLVKFEECWPTEHKWIQKRSQVEVILLVPVPMRYFSLDAHFKVKRVR